MLDRLAHFPYEKARIIFMRGMACLWMAKGLLAWCVILGIGPFMGVYENAPLQLRLAISGFALFDLVAAVGLWMLASWGAVIWLLTIAVSLILEGTIADANITPVQWPSLYLILAFIYLALLFGSRRFKDQPADS